MAETSEGLIIEAELRLQLSRAEKEMKALEKRMQSLTARKDTMLSTFGKVDPRLNADLKTCADRLAEVKRNVRDTKDALEEFGDKGKEALGGMDDAAGKLTKTMAAVFSLKMAKDFAARVVQTRGQFQQLEVAFTTLLGSEEKANKLMAEAVDLAAKTPFDLQGVADGARQLIAYGFASDEVIEDMRRLGDVAAGLGLPLQRLTYLYGTTRVQGRLYARDMLQFTNSGIPMLDVLAKKYGVTTSKINEMVSAGKIGFKDVKDAIEMMTNEGGRFANLMEKQSKTITGQISNIQDSIDVMFNEIGKKTEGPINKTLELTGKLIDNYETVGKVLGGLIAVYGVERVALMATAAMRGHNTRLTVQETLAKVANTAATKGAASAQMALNKAILANPYVLAAAAVAGLAFGIYKMTTRMNEAEKVAKRMKEATSMITEAETEERTALERLNAQLKVNEKGTDAWTKAKNEAVSKFGKYMNNLDEEITKVGTLSGVYDQLAVSINEAARVRSANKFIRESTDALNDEISGNIQDLRSELETKAKKNVRRGANSRTEAEELEAAWKNITDYVYGSAEMTESTIRYLALNKVSWRAIEDMKADSDRLKTLEADTMRMFGVTPDMEDPRPEDDPNNKAKEQEEEAEKIRQRRYNLKKKHEKEVRQLNRDLEDAEREHQKNLIDIMADGYAKERATNEYELNKTLDDIKRKREDKLIALRDAEREAWMMQNPDENKEYKFVSKIKELPEEWRAVYAQMEADAKEKFEKAMWQAFDNVANDFGTMTDKMLVKEREWAEKIEAMEKEITTIANAEEKKRVQAYLESMKARRDVELARMAMDEVSEYGTSGQKRETTKAYWEAMIASAPDYLRDGMQKAMEEALGALDLARFKESMDWEGVFGDLSTQTLEGLGRNMAKVREYLAVNRDDLNVEEIKELQEALANMSDEIASRNPFAMLAMSAKDLADAKVEMQSATIEYRNALRAQAEADEEYATERANAEMFFETGILNEAELTERLLVLEGRRNASADKVSRALVRLNAAENKAVSSAKKMEEGVKALSDGFLSLGSDVAGAIGVIDSEVGEALRDILDLTGTVVDATKDVVDALESVGKSALDGMEKVTEGVSEGVKAGAEASAEAISAVEKASVILAIVQAAVKVLTAVFRIVKANKEANDAASEAMRNYRLELERIADSSAIDKLDGLFGTASFNKLKAYTEQLKQAKAAMSGQGKLVADMRSGWQKFWGSSKNIQEVSISQFYKNGVLQVDMLRAWVDEYGEYLDDKTKGWAESLIAEGDRAQEALDGLNDYAKGIMGNMGSDIADIICDSILSGRDAFDDLADVGLGVIDRLAREMAQTFILENYLNGFQEDMQNALMGTGGKTIQEVIGAISAGLPNAVAGVTQMVEAIYDTAEQTGMDIDRLRGQTREATSKGIATASQESVDENNGRLTYIQGAVSEIKVDTGVIREQNERLYGVTANILYEVQGIHRDTGEMAETLHDIRQGVRQTNDSLEWMQTKGVKIQ